MAKLEHFIFPKVGGLKPTCAPPPLLKSAGAQAPAPPPPPLLLRPCSFIDTSEDMSKVKVFVTDGRMSFNVPCFCKRRGTTKPECHGINWGVVVVKAQALNAVHSLARWQIWVPSRRPFQSLSVYKHTFQINCNNDLHIFNLYSLINLFSVWCSKQPHSIQWYNMFFTWATLIYWTIIHN